MDEQGKLRTCFSLKTASDVRTSYSPRSWTSPGTREKATKYQRDKWSTGYTSDRGVMVTVTHPHPGCVRKHTPKCCGLQGHPVTRPVGRRRTSPRGEVGDEARLGDGRTGPPPGPPAERGGGGHARGARRSRTSAARALLSSGTSGAGRRRAFQGGGSRLFLAGAPAEGASPRAVAGERSRGRLRLSPRPPATHAPGSRPSARTLPKWQVSH